ncbi:LPXTG cell wall anchor domain-containing protein [Streptomyces incanus]|uniref:LPXTG cell wall anchor domain-containing protein n=1 Tax=Streptomyces incanus TaxID=887453 RepID=A0ABW0XP32_9ACTN
MDRAWRSAYGAHGTGAGTRPGAVRRAGRPCGTGESGCGGDGDATGAGSDTLPLAAGGAALVAAGVATVVLLRRRKRA